jgi:hypothetical protein
MKKYLSIALVFVITLLSINGYAQGVAVNTSGAAADSSAMLDISSSTKGVLIPRVTSTAAVTKLSNGLLVYQTNAPTGFYYYDGTTWIYIQNTGAVTGILKGNGTTVSAAVPADFPILNQNTTGKAATVTTNANLTGAITSVGNATSYNTVVPANKGGAGTVNGVLRANGAGAVTAASAQDLVSITDVKFVSIFFSTYSLSTTDGLVYTNGPNNQFTLPQAYTVPKGKVIYIRGDLTNQFTVIATSPDILNEANDGQELTNPTSTPLRSYGMYVSDGNDHWIEVVYR